MLHKLTSIAGLPQKKNNKHKIMKGKWHKKLTGNNKYTVKMQATATCKRA